MKRTTIFLFTVLLTGILHGQIDNSDIDLAQSMFGKSKRLIVSEYIEAASKDNNTFWKIYDQYEEKRKLIEKKRYLLLKEYTDNYDKLDNAEANKLITNFMKTTDAYNKLYKIYFKKAKRAVGGLEAATFIQLEIFIQISVQSDLQSQIPLIKELDKLNSQKEETETGILND